MYIAKIGGTPVQAGDSVTIPHITGDVEFEILEIKPASFMIKWLHKDANNQKDSLPFALFGHGVVSSFWVSDSKINPNHAFLVKRMKDDN